MALREALECNEDLHPSKLFLEQYAAFSMTSVLDIMSMMLYSAGQRQSQ
jgi:hypothetical protein